MVIKRKEIRRIRGGMYMNESGGERCLGGSSHKGVLGLGWPAISSGSPIIATRLKKNLTFTI